MSEAKRDPFDAVPDEDKVDDYQHTPEPEPEYDDERPVAEPAIDPEAPLDTRLSEGWGEEIDDEEAEEQGERLGG